MPAFVQLVRRGDCNSVHEHRILHENKQKQKGRIVQIKKNRAEYVSGSDNWSEKSGVERKLNKFRKQIKKFEKFYEMEENR